MNPVNLLAVLFVLCAAVALSVGGKDAARLQRIELPQPGKTMSLKDTIRGYEYADYVFDAPGGRALRITLASSGTSAYFNVIQDGRDEALFTGAMLGDTFDATLSTPGTYRVRVYQMRNDARRNVAVDYELTIRPG